LKERSTMTQRYFRPTSRIPISRRAWKPPAYPRVPSGVPSFADIPYKTYKLRNKILAGGKNILFGNNVSEFFNRTRRVWRLNIKVKSLWSEALGRRIRLRLTTSVLRTIDKVGGLDAYLTCTTRRRMKELGPRGWELRSLVLRASRTRDLGKYVRMFQRSILVCPGLRIDSQWRDIRPLVRHTEGYAVLPESVCEKQFERLMSRLRQGRSVVRREYNPPTIVLTRGRDSKFVRQVRLKNMPEHIKRRWRSRNPTARAKKSKRQSDERKEETQAAYNGLAKEQGRRAPQTARNLVQRERLGKNESRDKGEQSSKAKVSLIQG